MHETMLNNKTAKKGKHAQKHKRKAQIQSMHACIQATMFNNNHQKKRPRKKACTQTQKKVQRIHEFFMHIFQTKLVVTFKLS
jgi:hypothetical protein